MIKIAHADRFTEVEMFEMFCVDMEAAGAMAHEDVRGPNRFLWKTKRQEIADKDPKSIAATINPKTHEIIDGTPERIAMLREHAERVQADPELCPMLHMR